MTYVTEYAPGDKVTITADNTDTASPYNATHHFAIGTVVTLRRYDANDHTWVVDERRDVWVSEYAFKGETPPSEDEIQATLRSIAAAANPNVSAPPPPREIFNPDHCAPYTVITVGNPANDRVAIKLPDVKHASKNRWRDVNSGKIVDREDFRAGWDYYREAARG
jgi:hypothetical protein